MENKHALLLLPVAFLLLLGCTAQPGGNAGTGNSTVAGNYSLYNSTAGVAASGIGDADIDVSGEANETDLFPGVDGIEAENLTSPVNSTDISWMESQIDVSPNEGSDTDFPPDGIEPG